MPSEPIIPRRRPARPPPQAGMSTRKKTQRPKPKSTTPSRRRPIEEEELEEERPQQRSIDAALPAEVVTRHVFGWFPRWHAVSTLQIVSKTWRARCRSRTTRWAPTVLVTLSGENAVAFFGSKGGARRTLPAAPWAPLQRSGPPPPPQVVSSSTGRRHSPRRIIGGKLNLALDDDKTKNDAAEAERESAKEKEPRRVDPWSAEDSSTQQQKVATSIASTTYVDTGMFTDEGHPIHVSPPHWPTCLAASPRRLFVSQYNVRGVLFYKFDERGLLVFERVAAGSNDALGLPEGLVCVNDLLFVATCAGVVATVRVSDAALLSTARAPGLVFWNMIRGPCGTNTLLVAAHDDRLDDADGDYDEPTATTGGSVLKYEFDPATGRVDSKSASFLCHEKLNRPSGLALVGRDRRDLLVTTFIPDNTTSSRTSRRNATATRAAAAEGTNHDGDDVVPRRRERYYDDDYDYDDDDEDEDDDVPARLTVGGRTWRRGVVRVRLAADRTSEPGRDDDDDDDDDGSDDDDDDAPRPAWPDAADATIGLSADALAAAIPWGLSTSAADDRRVWISGHGRVLACHDAATGQLLLDAASPDGPNDVNDPSQQWLRKPAKAHPIVVLVV